MVLHMRRESAVDGLIAAAQQFPTRDKDVRAFGTGADVSFFYQLKGIRMRAGVQTGYRNNRLVVTNFGTQVWED